MEKHRRAGIVTGTLFFGATVCGVLSLVGRIPTEPDMIGIVLDREPRILFSGLMILAMGWFGAGIGISLYPVLRGHGPGMALGAAGFRVMEGCFHCLNAAGLFVLVASAHAAAEGQVDPSGFPATVAAIDTARSILGSGAGLISWCLGAVLYYSLFLKTRLIPRWLSVWGLAGLAPMAAASLLFLFRVLDDSSPAFIPLSLPIALQEMVMAGWLVVKGFSAPPIPSAAGGGSCRIRVAGHLGDEWSTWLGGAAVAREPDGSTTLVYREADQAVLFGALRQLRDAGLCLIGVENAKAGSDARRLPWKR